MSEQEEITYRPQGVCCQYIKVRIEENKENLELGKVTRILFIGGCPGNSLALSKILEGLTIKEVIDKVEGVRCGAKGTSCPDQLALVLKEYLAKGELYVRQE